MSCIDLDAESPVFQQEIYRHERGKDRSVYRIFIVEKTLGHEALVTII